MPDSTLKMLLRKTHAAVTYGRQNGIIALYALVRNKFRIGVARITRINVSEDYGFVLGKPIGEAISPASVASNTINWVIPPFGFGSGGHLNIMRFVSHLEGDGFDCNIIIVGEPRPASAGVVHKQLNDWFFPFKGRVYLGMESAPPANITIATSWQTAYYVRNFMPTLKRCYFVQDFEPCFYASGSDYAWAEDTYRFGFMGITAGSWLRDKLSSEYGMPAEAFGFSYDREIYKPLPRPESDRRRIFFYARPPTPRRAFEMGILVLEAVAQRLPDIEVILAGWDVNNYQIPFHHRNLGILPVEELPEVFSQCDAALVLSFSNISLLPLELMACGIPVISNRAPCTEWLLSDENAKLAMATVPDLANAVCSVLENPGERERLRSAGLAFANSTSWAREGDKVASILRRL